MSPLFIVARKDVLRHLKDPMALIFWVAIPLVVGVLMIQAVGGKQGPAPQVHLLVADEDDSMGSRFLLSALGQSRAAEFIRTEKVDRSTGRRHLEDGGGSALLVIPKGFAEAVLREQPTRLTLLTNPAQRILPGIAEQLLRSLAEGVFYLHRLIGPQLREIVQGPPSDGDIARVSITINQTIRSLGQYLFPPAIQLESTIVSQSASNRRTSIPFAAVFFPGIVLMALLFAAQGLSTDIWRERDAGYCAACSRRRWASRLFCPASSWRPPSCWPACPCYCWSWEWNTCHCRWYACRWRCCGVWARACC